MRYTFQQRTINVTDWERDALGMLSKTYRCMKCDRAVTVQITQWMRDKPGIVEGKEHEAMHALIEQGCTHIAQEPLEHGGENSQRAAG